MICLYGSTEWDARMTALWYAISWNMRALVENMNVGDLINMITGLMFRTTRLELLEQSRLNLFPLWF